MKLSEAIKLFHISREGEVADSTRNWASSKLGTLIEHLGDLEISDITINHLRQWRSTIRAQKTRWENHPTRPTEDGSISQDHFRNHIKAARQLFKWLTDEGILNTNPAQRLPMPPQSTDEPKAINVDDAQIILAMAQRYALRDMAYYRLLTSTPAKHGEIDRLTPDDIDPVNHQAIIQRRRNDKTYQPYPIKLDDETMQALGLWCNHRFDDSDLIFNGRITGFQQCVRTGIALGVRNHAIIQTLASSAARGGAIASLTLDNLHLNSGHAIVYTKGTGGGYKQSKIIFLDGDAVRAIRTWLSIHPGGNALFPGSQRQPLTRDGIYQVINNLANAASIQYSTKLHAWRHTWALEALRRGCDINTVARVLGNKPETVLKHYGRWATAEIQKRHQRYNWKTDES